MQLFHDFNQAEETVTGDIQTLQFNGPDIPGDNVVAYHVSFIDGAGTTTYGDISRIRVKAAGKTIIDVDREHFRALLYRMSRANYLIADADLSFTIPLYHMDAKGDDRYIMGFPSGRKPTVEIVLDGTNGVGTAVIGWTFVDLPPVQFPMFSGSAMNIGASSVNKRHNITEPGAIRALTINTVGLTKAEISLAGSKRIELSGTFFSTVQQLEGKKANESNDPQAFKLHGPGSAPGDALVTTGAAWVGIGNELGVYAILPQ